MKRQTMAIIIGTSFTLGVLAPVAVMATSNSISVGDDTWNIKSYGVFEYDDDSDGTSEVIIDSADIHNIGNAINKIDSGLGNIYDKEVSYTDTNGELQTKTVTLADTIDFNNITADSNGNIGIDSVVDDDGNFLSVTEAIKYLNSDLKNLRNEQVRFEIIDDTLYIITEDNSND